MKIHHFGIACNNIIKSKEQYENLGFAVSGELITDYERNLDYVFLNNGFIAIELIAKHQGEKKSDIDNILDQKKLIGNKIYHICYITNHMENDIKRLLGLGYKQIKPPSCAIACDNKKVAFLIHVDIGLIELVEE